MNVALLGYDTEGRESYDYFLAQGHRLTICDQNPELVVPAGAESILGDAYLDNLERFDLLVRTAGLPPHLILEKNPDVADKITTHINEFLKVCPTKHVIGVTGTKGKGTTSTLITKMLEASGKTVRLGGNIGVPPLSFLSDLDENSWVVLELSSFQLIDLQRSPHIAACLLVVPEHLDWHASVDEYFSAKSQLFAHQTADDLAIYFADNATSKQIANAGAGRKLPYFTPPGAYIKDGAIVISDQVICRTSELQLLGEHNWQNACAAVTVVWQASQDVNALRSILNTFSGLEHRLELVTEVDGVKYYDDSFGTTPETAIVALQALTQSKVLIAGGSDKGADYGALVDEIIANQVKHVVCIGITGNAIADLLEARKDERRVTYSVRNDGNWTMPEIVAEARQHAEAGDVVLLSTGSASFGLFKNYKDRGDQFKTAVRALSTTPQ